MIQTERISNDERMDEKHESKEKRQVAHSKYNTATATIRECIKNENLL